MQRVGYLRTMNQNVAVKQVKMTAEEADKQGRELVAAVNKKRGTCVALFFSEMCLGQSLSPSSCHPVVAALETIRAGLNGVSTDDAKRADQIRAVLDRDGLQLAKIPEKTLLMLRTRL
jgi:hypothetical protein